MAPVQVLPVPMPCAGSLSFLQAARLAAFTPQATSPGARPASPGAGTGLRDLPCRMGVGVWLPPDSAVKSRAVMRLEEQKQAPLTLGTWASLPPGDADFLSHGGV